MACNQATCALGLVILFLISKTQGSGEFQIELLNFKNDFGLNQFGACCNGPRYRNNTCSGTCKTYFRICLKNFQRNISPDACSYGQTQTPVVGENTFSLVPPRSQQNFKFNFEWRGDFSLIVEALYETSVGPSSSPALIHQVKFSGAATPSDPWKTKINRDRGIELGLRYRVLCDPEMFGSGCNVRCRPRNDNVGHYKCDVNGNQVCLPGYTGVHCEKPVCLQGCSSQHGYCEQPNDCRCKQGWRGHFCTQCIRVEGCDHGTCNVPNQCICEDGWGGGLCNLDLYFCSRQKPCQNNGLCTNVGAGSYKCTCPKGFTGVNCEISLFNCLEHQCLNDGSCSGSSSGSMQCICPFGFYGQRCENTCAHDCANGGTCSASGLTYQCRCSPGWTGLGCRTRLNPCESSPCQNGGTCLREGANYQCSCTGQFTGHHCEKPRLLCRDNPCNNRGTCVEKGPNGFECRCQPGYYGITCNYTVSYCNLSPCANGATCHSHANTYSCECPKEFEGERCDIRKNFCLSNPCKNGGQCLHSFGGFECQCVGKFIGNTCDREYGQSPTPPMPTVVEESTLADDHGTPAGVMGASVQELNSETMILAITLGSALPLLLMVLLIACFLIRRHRNTAATAAAVSESSSDDYVTEKIDVEAKGMNNSAKAAALKRQRAFAEGGSSLSSDKIINPIERPNQMVPQSNKTVEKKKFNDIIQMNRENLEKSSATGVSTTSELLEHHHEGDGGQRGEWLNPASLLQQQLSSSPKGEPSLPPSRMKKDEAPSAAAALESSDSSLQVENLPSSSQRHSSLATMV